MHQQSIDSTDSFNLENQELPDFREELQEGAKKAVGENAHKMLEKLPSAKMHPHL